VTVSWVWGVGVALCALVAGASGWAAQKHMQNALDHLRQAREALREAKGNKGGHRENAIDLVDKAIAQVEKGMEFAAED
jgi:hypothetical protein